jgi:hypothetical protein
MRAPSLVAWRTLTMTRTMTWTLALAMAGVACSSSSTGTGSGGTSGTGLGGSGGASSTGAGGGGAGAPGSGGSSATGAGGASSGTGGTASGAGGSAAGTGGTTGTGGATATGSGGTTGTGGAGGVNTSACPANATFCSGFETAGLPAGAIYNVNAAPGDWSRDFEIDTSQQHGGNSSLLVKNSGATGSSGSAYRMLAVPATAGAFWARFWVQSDVAMGSVDHNAFAGASIGSGPNDLMIEFAEDVGIAFNTSDSDVWPTGYGRLSGGGTNPYTIPAMTWKCVEISYDGTHRVQQLYIGGTQLINASGYPGSTEALTYFKFGFDSYHGPARQMWYDDVAVTPTRIPGGGCPSS